MYEIQENIPTVIALPTDKAMRVVWAYGALLHNRNDESNIPQVEVLLKEIDENDKLKEVPLVVKIEFTEIDIVRLGTIWQNRHRLNKIWESYDDYKDNMEFRFDFKLNQPDYIKFIDKNPKSNINYISIQKYYLGRIQGNKGHQYHFMNSIYTKLTTNTGTTVLVHGLEFLTSTYVPQEKNIRGKILNMPIDNILDEYVEADSFVEDDIYYMHFKENKRLANSVFLSYAKYNQTTRTRLSKLRGSLESDSNYNDRYPIVLPYHPEKMRIVVDGLWLDGETFLVLRIKGCSLPKENVLKIKKTKEETIDKTVTIKVETEDVPNNSDESNSTKENEDEEKNGSQYVDPSEIDIDSSKRPNKRNQSLQIVSEVEILDEDDVEVSYTEAIKQKNNYISKTEHVPKKKETVDTEKTEKSKNNKENKVDTVSSGDPSQSDKDKNTTSFEVLSNIEKSEMLVLVENALKDLKNKKENIGNKENIYINKLSYLNESCLESDIDQRPKFYSFINTENKTEKSWSIIKNEKKEEDYRRFMLVKIELNNGKYTYILEIDRRSPSESFSGFIFNYIGKEISKSSLRSLIKNIVKNRGVYSKLHEIKDVNSKKKNKRLEIAYPVGIQKIYDHKKVNGSMYKKMKRVLKEAYAEGRFI